jgi:hypothetical protein
MVDVFSDVIDFSYMLVPRSSIVKTPLRLANSIGIIDSGYRGNIMACVDNIDTLVEDEELEYYQIKQGDRLFQIVHPSLEGIKVELVDKLPSSNRTFPRLTAASNRPASATDFNSSFALATLPHFASKAAAPITPDWDSCKSELFMAL